MQFKNMTGKDIVIQETTKVTINGEQKDRTITKTIPAYRESAGASPKVISYSFGYTGSKTESVPTISGVNNITMTYDYNEDTSDPDDIRNLDENARNITVIRDSKTNTPTFTGVPAKENGVGIIVNRYLASLLNRYMPRRKDIYYPDGAVTDNDTGGFLAYTKLAQFKNFYPEA